MGQNKRVSKMLSAQQALKNIAPELYQEWKVKVKDGPSSIPDSEEAKVAPPQQRDTAMQSGFINPEALQL